jgi:hypothetical protein
MNANQTKDILKSLPNESSIMLRAKHGVGKSSVVKQAAQELGIEFFDIRLSQCEVGDLKGLPFLDTEEKRTDFAKPYWWPRDPNSSGILFFDELNRASKDVLQAVFEICLDRRLDGETLPAGWRVVTAVNADDEYDVVELDPALLDRWFIIDFDPSHKEWLSWATANDVSDEVTEFVRANPNVLDPPVGNLEAGRVYPSRRSWVACDKSLKALNLYAQGRNDGTLVQVVKGWLGSEIAAMFQKYVQNEFSRLRAADILDKWEEVKDRVEGSCSDIEVIASHANGVMAELKKKNRKIGDKQKEALKNFFLMLPSDVASSIWTELLAENKTKRVVAAWRNDPDMSEKLRRIYLKG